MISHKHKTNGYKLQIHGSFATLDILVFVENNANCAGLVEALFGAAKNSTRFISLTIYFDARSGVVLDQQLIKGNIFLKGNLVICCRKMGIHLMNLLVLLSMQLNDILKRKHTVEINNQELFDLADKGDSFAQKKVK